MTIQDCEPLERRWLLPQRSDGIPRRIPDCLLRLCRHRARGHRRRRDEGSLHYPSQGDQRHSCAVGPVLRARPVGHHHCHPLAQGGAWCQPVRVAVWPGRFRSCRQRDEFRPAHRRGIVRQFGAVLHIADDVRLGSRWSGSIKVPKTVGQQRPAQRTCRILPAAALRHHLPVHLGLDHAGFRPRDDRCRSAVPVQLVPHRRLLHRVPP